MPFLSGLMSGLAEGWAGGKIRQHNEQVMKEGEMLQWLQKVGAESTDPDRRDWANKQVWAIIDPSRKPGKPVKLEPPPLAGQGQQRIDAFMKGAPSADAPAGAGAGTVLPTQGASGQQSQPQAGVSPQQPQAGGTTDPMTGLPLGMGQPQGQVRPPNSPFATPPFFPQQGRPPGILGPTSEPAAAAPQVPQWQAAQAQAPSPLPPPPLVGTPAGGSVAQPPPGAEVTPQGWIQRTGSPTSSPTWDFFGSPGERAQALASGQETGKLQAEYAARREIVKGWDTMSPEQRQQAALILGVSPNALIGHFQHVSVTTPEDRNNPRAAYFDPRNGGYYDSNTNQPIPDARPFVASQAGYREGGWYQTADSKTGWARKRFDKQGAEVAPEMDVLPSASYLPRDTTGWRFIQQQDGSIKAFQTTTTSRRETGGGGRAPSSGGQAPAGGAARPIAGGPREGAVVGGKIPTNLSKQFDVVQDAISRLNIMRQNEVDGLKGDQQAMLSLLSNHVGMTMGLQPKARITQALYNEAQQSDDLVSRIEAHFDDRGYLQGVVLTPNQMRTMVGLAENRLVQERRKLGEVQEFVRQGGKVPPPPPGGGLIYARDPQGKLHSAPAGTVLPKDWKSEKAP